MLSGTKWKAIREKKKRERRTQASRGRVESVKKTYEYRSPGRRWNVKVFLSWANRNTKISLLVFFHLLLDTFRCQERGESRKPYNNNTFCCCCWLRVEKSVGGFSVGSVVFRNLKTFAAATQKVRRGQRWRAYLNVYTRHIQCNSFNHSAQSKQSSSSACCVWCTVD